MHFFPLNKACTFIILQDFTLHLSAVQSILEPDKENDPTNVTLVGLDPPIYKEKVTQNIHHWLNHIHLSQNIIDAVLKSNIVSTTMIKTR